MSDILFLTNNDNALALYEWIKERVTADYCDEKLSLDMLKAYSPKLVVSYNYKYIISAEVIDFMKGNIINMHISYLPWNKGSSPNLWSFVDNTPKGVTIHELTAGLDAGDIIYQREVSFDLEKDTLATSYDKLNVEIAELFKEHFDELLAGSYTKHPQIGKGNYHTLKDLKEFSEKVSFAWTDTLSDFIEKAKSIS